MSLKCSDLYISTSLHCCTFVHKCLFSSRHVILPCYIFVPLNSTVRTCCMPCLVKLQLLAQLALSVSHTVKPFNLAALKVGDLTCKIILAPFISAN